MTDDDLELIHGSALCAFQHRQRYAQRTLCLLAGAKQKALEMHDTAIAALELLGPEADYLRDISRYIIERRS